MKNLVKHFVQFANLRNFAERLLMRALALVAERKPPRPAPAAADPIKVDGPIDNPTRIPERRWRMPTPDEVDRARGECAAHALPHLKICRGPGKGCTTQWLEQQRCVDCYQVHWHDRRPSEQVIASLERGDA